MKRSILIFDKVYDNTYHTIIKNNHGRKLYLRVSVSDEIIKIHDCFYIDRPMRNGTRSIPHKQKTKQCRYDDLINVLASEIDKQFYGIEFSNYKKEMPTEDYIKSYLQTKYKYKFLILIENNGILKTRFKNRTRRAIYLEIKRNGNKGLIHKGCYCDRNNQRVTPVGLNTIYFDFSTPKVLEIVNNELNCDFTDVIITKDTFDFDKTNIPICGSI